MNIVGCTGIIKSSADYQLEFLGNKHINVDIWLINQGGQTKQPSLEFSEFLVRLFKIYTIVSSYELW